MSGVMQFGDPCARCRASSTATDPRDRECGCMPCPTCGGPSGNLCGYCGQSLGCSKNRHGVSVEQHVESGACPTTSDQRERVHAETRAPTSTGGN